MRFSRCSNSRTRWGRHDYFWSSCLHTSPRRSESHRERLEPSTLSWLGVRWCHGLSLPLSGWSLCAGLIGIPGPPFWFLRAMPLSFQSADLILLDPCPSSWDAWTIFGLLYGLSFWRIKSSRFFVWFPNIVFLEFPKLIAASDEAKLSKYITGINHQISRNSIIIMTGWHPHRS